MKRTYGCIAAAAAGLMIATVAAATPIQNMRTETSIDWTSAGVGGIGGSSATINLTGVSGTVRKAFLYWHGIDTVPSGGNGQYDNESIAFNGTPITGTSLGNATTNCWVMPATSGSSRAFRADVTSLVSGNGSYSVSGLQSKPGHSGNGASLVVTFSDGNANNNRDLVFFEGNDSNNPEGFAGEDQGWNATLAGINFQGGTVRAQLHASDGQSGEVFTETALTFMSGSGTVTVSDQSGRWDGDSVPNAGSGRAPNGALWDIHTFDLAGAFGAAGSYTISMSGLVPVAGQGDCLSLVTLLLDLEAGAAPATPTVTPTVPSTGECKDYFPDDLPQDIPDNTGSASSTLNVPDAGAVTDVDVLFLIGTHSFVGDLEFHLRSPMGTDVVIMNRVCGSNDNFDLDLDDEAGSNIPCPPTTEDAHKPSNPLSAFDGQPANGQWTLEVFDRDPAATGTLEDWALRVCRGGPTEPTHTATRTPTATHPPSASCCMEHDSAGCEVSSCENCVCNVVPSCCSEGWDEFCTMVANNECALQCPCTTQTPTRTRTATPTPSRTFTRSFTPTVTNTPTVTRTPTHTFTATHTFTFTHTFTPTFTSTPSRTPTATATSTATATPTSAIDLVADKIEVSQAVQDLNNSVRLVARKRTYVRFHVHSTGGSALATAQLMVRRGGDMETLNPINPGGQILVRETPNRAVRDHAFLFALPSGFRSGTVELTAVVNPGNNPSEGNTANNTVSTQVRYEVIPGQFLVMYKVGYSSGGNVIYPSDVHRAQAVVWMRRAFPVSEVRVVLRSYFFGRAVANGGNLDEPNCNQVNAFLTSKRLFDLASSPEVPRNGRYYGMVEDTAGFMRGCANGLPGFASSGPNGNPATRFSWDTDGSYGDFYAGHEVGHNLGRLHAEYCGAQGGGPFPYPEGRISPTLTGDNAIYGFDIVNREIYGPDWKDVMTYCPFEWISDYTYEGLMDFYRSGGGALRVAPAGVVTNRVLVVGTIDPTSMAVDLEPLFIVPNAGELKERIPGPYSIVLRDAGGAELARYPFTPEVIQEEGVNVLFINELVPFVEGTSRVDIDGPSGNLHSVSAGPAAPTVQLVAPNGGEMLDQPTVTVSWTADDSDGDLLTFSLQYSKDGGATWEIIAQYLEDNQVELDAANIGRTEQGKFRVLVSDGVQTGSDDSDGVFTVPNRFPSAVITEPSGPLTIALGQTLSLEGDAYDVDTGTLLDEQLQWSSSLDGALGSGPSVAVATLTLGEHTISFRADDGEGGVTTATVAVTVVPDIDDLPPIPDALVAGPVLLTVSSCAGMPLSIENENPVNDLSWTAVTNQPWLRLSATSGSTPAEVTVSVDPAAGLTPGRYDATITVDSSAGSQTIGVEANVSSPCAGDCDCGGGVAINELILGVNIALGQAPLGECSAFDGDASGSVTIGELVQAVNSALNGCD